MTAWSVSIDIVPRRTVMRSVCDRIRSRQRSSNGLIPARMPTTRAVVASAGT